VVRISQQYMLFGKPEAITHHQSMKNISEGRKLQGLAGLGLFFIGNRKTILSIGIPIAGRPN
jgi:hypothetical protein